MAQGETEAEAVKQALRDRLVQPCREHPLECLADELDEIARHCAELPSLESRTPDNILGYDEEGLPR
jgi:antitoxin VapB